jgi:hypothetical protein
MKRIRILGRKPPTKDAQVVQTPNIVQLPDLQVIPPPKSASPQPERRKIPMGTITIEDAANLPVMNQTGGMKGGAFEKQILRELTNVLMNKKEIPKTPEPSPVVTPIITPSPSPAPQVLIEESLKVSNAPSVPANCAKTEVSNDEIIEFMDMFKSPVDEMEEKNILMECQLLKDNELKPKETARFTITTENLADIQGFAFSIQSDVNFIHTSHLESVEGNKVSVLLNNLTNKSIKFGVYYIAVF